MFKIGDKVVIDTIEHGLVESTNLFYNILDYDTKHNLIGYNIHDSKDIILIDNDGTLLVYINNKRIRSSLYKVRHITLTERVKLCLK